MSVDPRELCYELLRAETEDEVTTILEAHGFLTDDSRTWVPYGGAGFENNRGTIHNQQADAGAAIVEKIINSVDAVLLAECWRSGIDPESDLAPQNMREAAEKLFSVRNGRLDSLDAGSRTRLADYIHFIATGAKSNPNYVIVDRGEGQTPKMMPSTFLSLHARNKYGIPFTQGINNCGGTGVLPFCGECGYQLIISRRHSDVPLDANDPTKGLWGFTLVRRLRPEKGKRPISMYVYFAPDGKIPSFAADELLALPGRVNGRRPPTPYQNGLPYGSCIKLYTYRWSPRSLATTNARAELEKWLYTLCLPVRITETRDYNPRSFQTTLSGLSCTIADHGDTQGRVQLEPGFAPASASISPEGVGDLPITIAVHKKKDEAGKTLRKGRIPHGVVLTINGQVHSRLRPDFVSAKLRFSELAAYLHVAVDCTDMPPDVSEDLFMPSRDRHRSKETYDCIEQELVSVLREHQGLKMLNALRRQERLKEILTDKEPLKILQALIDSDPTLAALLGKGNRIHKPDVPERTDKPYEGKRFPTYFRLRKEPTEGLLKECPVNRTCRVEFETDASNDYFVRGESPGKRKINLRGTCTRESLFNGRYLAQFALPHDCVIGDEIPVTVEVTDNSRPEPFLNGFKIRVAKAASSKPSRSGRSRPKGGQELGAPLPIMVTEDGREIDGKPTERWEDHDFHEFSAVKVALQGEQDVDIYINMDNDHLKNELKREARTSEQPTVMYWFKYGLFLSAMGMLQEMRRQEIQGAARPPAKGAGDGDGADGNGEPASKMDLPSIQHALSGLAVVIVPVIRRLSEGPRV